MIGQAPPLGGYSAGRVLGQGGYSVVYLYRDESLGQEVAVKVLTLLDESARGQFADEIRLLSSFGDDPLIVPFVRHGVLEDGRPYFVMRYCPGGSISSWVGDGLPAAEVVETGLRIGRALDSVHRKNWLHRDIKPSNILVDETGHAPRLSDFGIATPSRYGVAGPGDPPVSIAWSAPEVIAKQSSGSVASDLYSLGATLWHLLTGHAPYEIPGGDNRAEALERRVMGSALPVLGRDGVPTALEHLLRNLLAKEPGRRPGSAADVVRVLELIKAQLRAAERPLTVSPQAAVITESPAQVPRAAESGPSAGFSGRKALIVCAAVVVVAGAVAVGAGLSDHAGSGTASAQAGSPTGDAVPGPQDPGLAGEQVPAGVPKIKAARTGSGTLRFSWTYTAPEASDTFGWRVVGTTRTGVAQTAAIDLSDPAGQRLCIQVRVLRAGDGDQDSAWSPADCGS
ncbi:serine/threonine protein kinase [Actinospica robiniae]|uniref:serine/threonine protein kinase n=1 Tax=Actinospica robiniae TaxID=304901 RepID=UPI0004255C1C|nr:serine/threonine-protein kinase [Actinospica robiniae]